MNQKIPGSLSTRVRHSRQDTQMPLRGCDHEVEHESSGRGSGDRLKTQGDRSWRVWIGFGNRSGAKPKVMASVGLGILANKGLHHEFIVMESWIYLQPTENLTIWESFSGKLPLQSISLCNSETISSSQHSKSAFFDSWTEWFCSRGLIYFKTPFSHL